MAVTEWKVATINGRRMLTISLAQLQLDLDNIDAGVFIAVAAPLGLLPGGGAVAGGIPALVKGDAGPSVTLQTDVDFTALENDDPTDDFAFLTEIAPATANEGPVYQLALGLHKGPAGNDGAAIIDPTDYGSPVAKQMLVVNGAADGFELATQKVADRFIPATVTNAPALSTSYTLAQIPVDGQPFDWRPRVSAQTTVTPSGSNIRVNLIARLNNETTGNDVGAGFGISGATERINITDGPPAGSSASYDKVLANADATIYIRIERQSGTDTFSTANTRCSVTPIPIP